MKKIVFFVVLVMMVIGSLVAQSVNETQRIVGTWIATLKYDGLELILTYVFNANGTGTYTEADNINNKGETINIFWGVSPNGELCINGGYNKFAITPDGKIMFISTNRYQKK